MLSSLLAFEARKRVLQPEFLLMALACLAYGLTLSFDAMGDGMARLTLNSPFRLAYFIALSSALASLAAMILCSQDVLRDDEYQFASLIGGRAPRALWFSRWLAIQLTVLLLLSLISLGLLLGFALPRADREALLPLQASSVLLPWLCFVLPNSLIVSSLLFWVSYRWRRSGLTFAAAILLCLLSLSLLILSGAPLLGRGVMVRDDVLTWFSLLDPLGLVEFFAQSRTMSSLQKDSMTLLPGAALLLNRILWVLVGAMACWRVLCRVESDALRPMIAPVAVEPGRTKPVSGAAAASATPAEDSPQMATVGATLACIAPSGAQGARFLALLRRQMSLLYGNWAMRLLLLLWLLQVATGILMTVGYFSGAEYSGRYPTTSLLISYCAETLGGYCLALLVLFSVELLWLEKRLQIDTLLDSTGTSNLSFFAAKLLALVSIPMLLISLLIALAAGYQWAIAHTRVQLLHYLSLYGYFGLPLVLQAVALFCVQLLWAGHRWANRYSAWVIGALFTLSITVILPTLAAEYPLLQFNQFPRLLRVHSEMAHYGQFGERFAMLAVYWSAVAFCLLVIAVPRWPRGAWRRTCIALQGRSAQARARSPFRFASSGAHRALAAGLVLAVAAGCWLQWQLPDNHDDRGPQAQWDSSAHYERAWSAYRDRPVPQVSSSVTRVDLHPEQQRVEIAADSVIHNRNRQALQEILVTSWRTLDHVSIDAAELVKQDSGLGWHTYLFKLRRPLQPGASTAMHYRLRHASQAFAIDPGLVSNGSYFHQGKFEPVLGYVGALEIDDAGERKQRRLPARTPRALDGAHGDVDGRLTAGKRHFEAIVSTSAEQLALTSGELLRQWQQDGRHLFHYRATQPIHPIVGYFSAAYVKRRFDHRGTAIEFYVHPGHERNIETMLRAVRATLDYGATWFGPYPNRELRIVEVPNYHPFGGRASAGVIALNERLFLENVADGALINNVLRNTVHEVAHQWWGEKLLPRPGAGKVLLTESLAKYVEAVVLGQLQGERASSHLRDFNRRRYFEGRSQSAAAEVPLVQAEQAYLSYGKGPLVFLALRDLLGEARLNAALAKFLALHADGTEATAPALLEALKQLASDAERPLIDDWLAKVIEYRLGINKAVSTRLADGRYAVAVDLTVERLAYARDGRASAIALDEAIPVGLFAEHPNRSSRAALAAARVPLREGANRIVLVSDLAPAYVAIDPEATRIEMNREDNVLSVSAAAPRSQTRSSLR